MDWQLGLRLRATCVNVPLVKHDTDFGLLISYILPGFIVLLGLAHHYPLLQTWIGEATDSAPSLGGFLYLTVASIFIGLGISTLRWLVLDTIHHATKLKAPRWDFSKLAQRENGYQLLIDIHYRYYQFYGNSIFGIASFGVARWTASGWIWWEVLLVTATMALFFVASRDTLRKYYSRVDQLLSGVS